MPPQCADPEDSKWMLNKWNKNPCQVAEQVVQICQPGAKVPNLPTKFNCSRDPVHPLDPPTDCCCSSVTYALFSACWLCEYNDDFSKVKTTYLDFVTSCPSPTYSSYPASIAAKVLPVDVPAWASIPPTGDMRWDPEAALNASLSKPRTTIISTPSIVLSFSHSSSPSSSSESETHNSGLGTTIQPAILTASPAIIAGSVVGSIFGFALLLLIAWLIYRYRLKHRVIEHANPGTKIDLAEDPPEDPPLSPVKSSSSHQHHEIPSAPYYRSLHTPAPHPQPQQPSQQPHHPPPIRTPSPLYPLPPAHDSRHLPVRPLPVPPGPIMSQTRDSFFQGLSRLQSPAAGGITRGMPYSPTDESSSDIDQAHLPPSAQYLASIARRGVPQQQHQQPHQQPTHHPQPLQHQTQQHQQGMYRSRTGTRREAPGVAVPTAEEEALRAAIEAGEARRRSVQDWVNRNRAVLPTTSMAERAEGPAPGPSLFRLPSGRRTRYAPDPSHQSRTLDTSRRTRQ